MFQQLSEKFNAVFRRVRGQSHLSETNIDAALRDVRLSLLEADVHFKVVKEFTEAVKTRSMGHEVLRAITPGQQFVKVVHQELVRVLGSTETLNLAFKPPVVILLVGLQGSGKTTTAAKLALHLKKQKRQVLLVPADIYRPAAIEQLKTLGDRLSIAVYPSKEKENPVHLAIDSKKYADSYAYDVVIIDSAGRLHIDETLLKELQEIQKQALPQHTLLVVDAMTGQEAVRVAQNFDARVPLSGVILTKMDGDARGGAALSIRHVLGKPIFFVGMGEKSQDFEVFHPDRMASRVLGMGDILSLVEKAQENLDMEKAKETAERVFKQGFSLQDFEDQLGQMKRLGPLEKIIGMMPGMGDLKKNVDPEQIEKTLRKKQAILHSMTRQEKRDVRILDGSRRLRIARGSGTQVSEINQLLKEFTEMKKMIDSFGKSGLGKLRKLGSLFGRRR